MLCPPATVTSTRQAGWAIPIPAGRMRAIPVADYPERQGRQQAFTPTETRDILSDDACAYVDNVPILQRQAADNAYLNGLDAERRLEGSSGG